MKLRKIRTFCFCNTHSYFSSGFILCTTFDRPIFRFIISAGPSVSPVNMVDSIRSSVNAYMAAADVGRHLSANANTNWSYNKKEN